MRIERLDLIAFGPFSGAVLDLSGGAEGLHLVYGPNEAGKSSALRAIQQLFRGIPHQSSDNFVHQHADMRIGALLRDREGSALEIVRRKGTRNTLLGPDGKPIDEADARLARVLGGVTPDEFLKKFVIDHAELVDGGKTVSEGGGDLGRVLFAAGSGLAGLGTIQKQLDDEAEALFKRGGSKPLINLKLAELEATRKKIKDDTLRSSEWREHDEALRAALSRKDALEHDLEAAVREQAHLRNLSEGLDPIARRSALLEELRDLADAPRLSADFTFRRRDAESRIGPNEKFEADALRKSDALGEALEALDVPALLLEQADAIKALHLRLGHHQKARSDEVRLEAERARFEADARAILRDLGRDPGVVAGEWDEAEALEALRLKAPDRAAVHDLANERQALLQTRDEAEKALQALDARSRTLTAKLAATGTGRDSSALRKAVKRAQAQGDLDALLVGEREALKREQRRAGIALKALGLRSGALDELEAMPVPSNETIDRFQGELEAASAERDTLQRLIDERLAEAQKKAEEIEQLQRDGEVPTEDALITARLDRESAWERLKPKWDDSLASTYERAVRAADEAADRLRREARRVGDHARLFSERARLAAALDDLRERHRSALDRLAEIQGRWLGLWQPLGIAGPGTPREMLAWSRKAADLAALAGSAREKAEAVARREEQIATHRRDLAAALVALGEPTADRDEPLLELIERAQDVIDAVGKESKARDRFKDDLETLKSERADREEAASSAQAAWDHWQGRWAAAMARIGLSPAALPSEANTVLSLTADLFDRLEKARDHRLQIETIRRESAQFKREVWALADRVAPDLAIGRDFDAETAAAELADRLDRAQLARQRFDNLTAQLSEQEQALAAARAEITRARAELATLRREARCDSDLTLPSVEERSGRRQKLEKELSEQTATLLKLSAGSPLEAFLAQAEQADPAGLALRVVRLGERISELERERETTHQTIGEERMRLSLMDGSARAADAGQDAEDLRARIKSDVEHYARLRLASAVLRSGIERYREKAQGPVLARASALFSSLTLGSFEGLAVDYDDRDEPVLKGVRSGTRESVGVSCMSLGTADQLYLALRLATLETYLDRREALPLVVDDILIQFDNPRSSATLSALAALSRRTQVLVFTHHEHLRDLAASAVPGEVLFHHELPGRA